jgi:hypothetical protein
MLPAEMLAGLVLARLATVMTDLERADEFLFGGFRKRAIHMVKQTSVN